ncbi:MAG: hypothetical protein A2289_25005 [Deltaproteobacteria bacterium RIFOXYA12_FULL_58_15]|nr:MAG: hypothetical protein A2289_25005 [Deltaproteobacteria bacterium RIFOXYA12_FULL_58_15]OGR11015.1 MAG: hypothetical protein A2341_11555 [Deltaproteobacteria bacterium RIFOXYB12_FULL_58_9]
MKNGFVADANVGVAWAVYSQASPETDFLLDAVASGEQLFVPSLWPFEVANALTVLVRRKKILQGDRETALQALSSLPLIVDEEGISRAFRETAVLANKTGLTVYDAAYLELAIRRRLPLATTDLELVKIAERHKVHLLLSSPR